jgi:hypothetical protein
VVGEKKQLKKKARQQRGNTNIRCGKDDFRGAEGVAGAVIVHKGLGDGAKAAEELLEKAWGNRGRVKKMQRPEPA